jgi:hypothetical protein
MIHTYDIKQSDFFIADLYPHAVNEVMALKRKSIDINTPFKEQVVISFLKNHSITSIWLESDREICELMTSGSLKLSHLESLFNGCRQNQKFLEGFETYIKAQLQADQ